MSRPMSACGTRRPTMVVPEPATPHVLRLTRPPPLAPLITLSHSPTEDDGFWAIDEDLASAQRRTGFFETAKNKLSEVIRTGRAPLVADLGLAYLEVDRLSGLAGDGMMTLAWTPFGDEAANEVFKALMAKAGANESAAACLERLLRRGAHSQSAPTKISFTSERVPYTLFIGGSTFTPSAFDPPDPIGRSSIGEQTTRLEQHNTRTHHVRSVSFFTVAGKPYHEPMVVCGSNMSITEGDTRTGDRDASSSKEASSLAAALPAPLFRRLIPDSVDDDGALFSTIASTLRSTLPLSDDTVYVRAGARALAETNPPVCVVAIHMVNHPQRRELFELARQHLTAARGEGGANEGIALHGTSLGAVAPICKRGFVVRERNHTQFGVGVYFSPVPRPFEPLEEDAGGEEGGESKTATGATGAMGDMGSMGSMGCPRGVLCEGCTACVSGSTAADDSEDYTTGPCHAPMALDALYSSPDKTGLQHILLCRVLRGTTEKLRNGGGRGNPQFQPSSDAFDSGVDVDPLNDLDNARRLVVWGANLSTHVRPIAVISVRVLDPRAHCLEECVDGKDPIPCG